ncbi:MAG: sigma-70 family RNA polymerase sigma factor [Gammaproteobacteria bacterium]|nr:sigma-70 family RNA polymerase sigma factor [Gammaproteobacteria bacterium]
MTDIHNDDLAAFREQLVALLPRLRRVARGYTRNVADADDLVQLAIERALLRWQQWQRGTRLDCWMFGILRNAWFDELRARRRHAEVLLEDEQAGTQVAGGDGGQPLQALAVEAALLELPEEQRMAVLLVLVEGLSYKEAAAALDVPIGTLTSRLARGREALARVLA